MSGGRIPSAAAEDDHRELTADLTVISVHDRKDEALLADLMDKLNTEVYKSLDVRWTSTSISHSPRIETRYSEILAHRAMSPHK